jgi:tRNA A-37 threonylcarbamoyl transferase component Bud32
MVTQVYRAAVFLQTIAGKAKTNEKQCLELEKRVETIILLLKIKSTDLERPHLVQPLNNLHSCIKQCTELVNKCQEDMPWYWKLFYDSSYTQQFESLNGKLSHYINDLQFGINSKPSFDLTQEYSFPYISRNDLIQEQLIGQGGFADVYRGIWRSQNKEVAIKLLRIQHLDAETEKDFMNEVSTMCNIHYDHILSIFGGCIEAERYILVVEYMSLGSLYDVLRKRKIELTWPDRWSIARQMIQGINYLHSLPKPIIHRDIKSLNILMTQRAHELVVKISDFGLARIRQKTSSGSSCNVIVGTLAWKAPEILRMEKHTEASDVYALGIVLWELATGQIPYEDHDESTISAFVRGGDRLEIPASVPISFAQLISSTWAHEHKQRPSCEQLLDLMKNNSDDSTSLIYTQVSQYALRLNEYKIHYE